jgi:membrane fusion protein (multidrug efflux system)
MFAKVEVVVPGSNPVVTVPQSAVAYALHGDSVFLVKDGKDGGKEVTRAVVQVGERHEGRVSLLAGVAPGDVVVTSGQLKLDNGSKVSVEAGDPLRPKATTAVE